MIDQQINEQLSLLQKELTRLKKVTDYIDGAKENSISIISELENVQLNYADYTSKIFNLYKQYVIDLNKNTEKQINEGVLNFEKTGNRIDTTNKEKLVETKRLLEQYKKIVEATDNLVKKLEAVDFPSKLLNIDKTIQSVHSTLTEAKQSIEKKQSENQTFLLERLDQQHKEIKELIDKTIQSVHSALSEAKQSIEKKQSENQTFLIERLDQQRKEIKGLKTLLFVVCGLIIVGILVSIFVK